MEDLQHYLDKVEQDGKGSLVAKDFNDMIEMPIANVHTLVKSILKDLRRNDGVNHRLESYIKIYDKDETLSGPAINEKNRSIQDLMTLKIQEGNRLLSSENLSDDDVKSIKVNVVGLKHILLKTLMGILYSIRRNTNPSKDMLSLIHKTQDEFNRDLIEDLSESLLLFLNEIGINKEFIPSKASISTLVMANAKGHAMNASAGGDLHIKNSRDFHIGISKIPNAKVKDGYEQETEKTQLLKEDLANMEAGDNRFIRPEDGFPTTKGWNDVLLGVSRYLNTEDGASQAHHFKSNFALFEHFQDMLYTKIKEKFPDFVPFDKKIGGDDTSQTIADVIEDEYSKTAEEGVDEGQKAQILFEMLSSKKNTPKAYIAIYVSGFVDNDEFFHQAQALAADLPEAERDKLDVYKDGNDNSIYSIPTAMSSQFATYIKGRATSKTTTSKTKVTNSNTKRQKWEERLALVQREQMLRAEGDGATLSAEEKARLDELMEDPELKGLPVEGTISWEADSYQPSLSNSI